MKCADFILARETGGAMRRFLARWHAAGCPRCAAEAARLDAVEAALASAEPLTRRQRRLWIQAAATPLTSPRRRWPLVAGLGAAGAVAALLFVFLHKTLPSPSPEGGTTVVVYDPKLDLDRLAADCQRLDGEIDRLLQEADRLDAQRRVAMTLDHFAKW